MQSARQNFTVQKWITSLSVVLFLLKIIAYYITGSLAILTDALESIVNVVAGFVGLYSLYIAAKPSDRDHPYGHGKAEFISAAVEGGLIVSAGLVILYQTIRNFFVHTTIGKLDTGLILVAITGIINYIAGSYCIKKGKQTKSVALQSSGKHLKIDTYSTAAIIIGLVIILYTKQYWLDRALAIALSGMILYNGYTIIRTSLAGIMDEADMQLLSQMVKMLNDKRSKNWIDIHNLRVIKYGSLLHVDCHLTVPYYFMVNEAHKEVEKLRNSITSEFDDAFELFVHTDGCIPPQGCAICIKEDCNVRQQPLQKQLTWTLTNVLLNKKHTIETNDEETRDKCKCQEIKRKMQVSKYKKRV